MARTQAADYDERKQEIVETAAALFAERGFNGASVADIAQRGKISKSLIYHYYESKEDILYDVMISPRARARRRRARGRRPAMTPPERKLRELTHRFMALYVGAADRHKVLLNDLDHLPKARRAEIVAVQRGLIEIVQQAPGGDRAGAEAQAGASFAAAMLFFGTINWTHTWFDPNGAVSAGALAEMAVDLTLGGVRKAAE